MFVRNRIGILFATLLLIVIVRDARKFVNNLTMQNQVKRKRITDTPNEDADDDCDETF